MQIKHALSYIYELPNFSNFSFQDQSIILNSKINTSQLDDSELDSRKALQKSLLKRF